MDYNSGMRAQEFFELALIFLATGMAAFIGPLFPARLSVGALCLLAASVLLAQSLVRDLVLIYANRNEAGGVTSRTANCMCVESMLGFSGVILGVLLLLSATGGTIVMNRGVWCAMTAVPLVAGLLLKDWVITWRPWGVSREKDHLNLIVRWRG